MNRLQSELQRLYLMPSADGSPDGGLIGAAGEVRALVLELARPADWEPLSRVWRGVQTDFELPAPAIAVSGSDGLQLWFSLQQPVDARRAAAFLRQLQARYLHDVAPTRLGLWPSAGEPLTHAALVPAEQATSGNWSAFVAPDLAPVFVDTPWLDIPPGIEGQADLLAKLASIKPSAFDAIAQPRPSVMAAAAAPAPQPADAAVDPRRFLQRVMNDVTVAMALRIEAAKALLQDDRSPPP